MTAQKGVNGSIRLHVGGLARGIQPAELAALVARALPAGSAPTAEIMRDPLTGIERGFGYVTVVGDGEAATRRAAESAVAVYNGTKWRGGKLKVGLAKGDYKERLKDKWAEAEETRAKLTQEADAARAAANDHASYKAPAVLRLRRRPGDPVIFVDPTPIPWNRRASGKKGLVKSRGSEGGAGTGDVRREGEPEPVEEHRRKRGVSGSRRKMVFPGGEAVGPRGCLELWKKHLQDQGDGADGADGARRGGRAGETRLVERSGEQLALSKEPKRRGKSARANGEPAADLVPDGDDAADLVPEEAPPTEGIEFLWDDDDGDGGDSDLGGDRRAGDDLRGRRRRGGSLSSEVALSEESDAARDGDRGSPFPEGVSGGENGAIGEVGDGEEDSIDEKEGEQEQEEEEEVMEVEDEEEEVEEERSKDDSEVSRRRRKGIAGDARSQSRWDGQQGADAVKSLAAGAARQGGGRLGKKFSGLDLDERLKEILNEDEDDGNGDGNGGYDYELETAKKCGVPVGAGSVGGTGTNEAMEEGMSERLKAEAERSLGILAQVLGEAHTSFPASRGGKTGLAVEDGARRHGVAKGAKNSYPELVSPSEGVGAAEVDGVSHPEIDGRDVEPSKGRTYKGLADDEDASSLAGRKRLQGAGHGGEASHPEVEDSREGDPERRAGPNGKGASVGEGTTAESLAGCQDSERFVAHLPTLTEIFRVEDKVSTKKNAEEKKKDTCFLVASLFDKPPEADSRKNMGREADEGAASGFFSFSFDEEGVKKGAGDGLVGAAVPDNPALRVPASDDDHGHPHGVAPQDRSDVGKAEGEHNPSGREGLPEDGALSLVGGSPLGASAVVGSRLGLWGPLGEVIELGSRFVRADRVEDVEATWLKGRKAFTEDFKRKHKDAVKGRRGVRLSGGLRGGRGLGGTFKRRRLG